MAHIFYYDSGKRERNDALRAVARTELLQGGGAFPFHIPRGDALCVDSHAAGVLGNRVAALRKPVRNHDMAFGQAYRRLLRQAPLGAHNTRISVDDEGVRAVFALKPRDENRGKAARFVPIFLRVRDFARLGDIRAAMGFRSVVARQDFRRFNPRLRDFERAVRSADGRAARRDNNARAHHALVLHRHRPDFRGRFELAVFRLQAFQGAGLRLGQAPRRRQRDVGHWLFRRVVRHRGHSLRI